MHILPEDQAQDALDRLTERFGGLPEFVSVELTSTHLIVRLLSLPSNIDLPCSIGARDSQGEHVDVHVEYLPGPAIVPSLGRVGVDPIDPSAVSRVGEMGGDECRNMNASNYYGTIGLFAAKATVQLTGKCNVQCVSEPALLSNNHVIARSDAGHAGEQIFAPTNPNVAKLKCIVPFRCESDIDFALAQVEPGAQPQYWTVRTIGLLGAVRRPRIGESIQKHGARTGYTTGVVTGVANIRVGNYLFRGVFVTTGGFACPGDSGSAVVATSNRDLLGLHSWGDDVDCSQRPRGYFWTFIRPGQPTTEGRPELTVSR